MKELLLLCRKNVDFSYNEYLFLQEDDIAMESPFGPTIAEIVKVELQRILAPGLNLYVTSSKRYVDGTTDYFKENAIEHVLSTLNFFYKNISFIYEKYVRMVYITKHNKTSFFDFYIDEEKYSH